MEHKSGPDLRSTTHVAPASNDDLSAAETIDKNDLAREGSLEPQALPDRLPGQATPPQPKVLIVEDAIELAEVIAATLERINIRSYHETHVDRAINVYESEHPDMILLDIGLPDKTGWKLLDEIRQRSDAERPVVIVITAHGDPANRLMGKLQGVHSYLLKPFTPDQVEAVVRSALANPVRMGSQVATDTRDPAEDTEPAPLPEFIREMLGQYGAGNPLDAQETDRRSVDSSAEDEAE